MTRIHDTAIVDTRAEIDSDVEIGPYSIVGAGVRLGKGTRLKSHVVVEGRTTLGEGNLVFQFASVGSVPQDLKYEGEPSELIVGDHNTFREFVSINPGTTGGGMVTRIGDRNLLMMQCHVAHDCILGDDNVLANSVILAGHVVVGDWVVFGGVAGVVQFTRIGSGALVGAGAKVAKDVPPYCRATGYTARLRGLNFEGLKRRRVKPETVEAIRRAYRILFRSQLTTHDAIMQIRHELAGHPEADHMATFVADSQRGVCR